MSTAKKDQQSGTRFQMFKLAGSGNGLHAAKGMLFIKTGPKDETRVESYTGPDSNA